MGTDSYESFRSTVAPPIKPPGGLSNMEVFSIVIYCVIFVLGTIGNSLVIYVTGFRMKKTVNSIWFLNLALADFLFTVFLILTIVNVSRGYNWPFGDFMCKLHNLVSVVNMFASIFLLMAISLDRCLSTWVVVWAQNKRTPRKAQIICVVIWLAALACSLPYVILREVREVHKGRFACTYSKSMDKWSLTIFRFVLGFLVPFLVITLSYVAIAVRARRLQRGRKRKSLRIIIAIIFAFFLCWLPFHVFQFIEFKAYSSRAVRHVMRIGGPLVIGLAFLNSCLNPILYVFMCDEFQKKLKQSICLVLETALAEDHLSFVSSRSLASHLSRISRKSDSGPPIERKGTSTSLTATNSDNVASMEERETLNAGQDPNIQQPV
ncbi:chemerin-like receptor 1 [Centroberyx gerrardi]|uniref:chemerin-like receptor 1 n=1 Tax=Centroberyx gerrardi TaxID=166262 RepID=UPI003AADB023